MTETEVTIRRKIFFDVVRACAKREMNSDLYIRLLDTILDGAQTAPSLPRQQAAKVIPFPRMACR